MARTSESRIVLSCSLFALLVGGGCAADAPPPAPPPGGEILTGIAWPIERGVLAPSVGVPLGSTWAFHPPGAACVDHADCDSAEGAGDGFCYAGAIGTFVFPAAGYCTIDDGTGTVCEVDGDCPSGSLCADSLGYKLCLPACGDGGACGEDQACLTSFLGNPLDRAACVPGNREASDGDGCAAFYECNADSLCWNDVENPGGLCTSFACELGTNAGCHGGICIEFTDGPSTGTVCVQSCITDDECREAEGYVCHDPDGPGGAGAYCRHPHVGDPCQSADDCGGDGWRCLADPEFPGGHCTVAAACPAPGATTGCSSGSVCATVGDTNLCVDRCATVGGPGTCASGYTCAAVGAENGGGCLRGQDPGSQLGAKADLLD